MSGPSRGHDDAHAGEPDEDQSPIEPELAGPESWVSATNDTLQISQALLEVDHRRLDLQRLSREALVEAGLPVSRDAVIRGAYEYLLDEDRWGRFG